MSNQPDSVLRTFRLDKETIENLRRFMQNHPEVGSLNHLVEVALREFYTIHRKDKTWLKTEDSR